MPTAINQHSRDIYDNQQHLLLLLPTAINQRSRYIWQSTTPA
jgi:hypothetical protein